ncbi:MAG: hypothetical protein WDM94_10460 [Bauldia sp.]
MDLRAYILAAAVAAASPAGAADWDATWVGGFDNGGDGVQVIIAGDTVVGFFLGGDYLEVTDPGALAADGSLSFKWDGGAATLSAAGDSHTLTIHAAGAADRVIELKRDQ